jgi:hypothetical protein
MLGPQLAQRRRTARDFARGIARDRPAGASAGARRRVLRSLPEGTFRRAPGLLALAAELREPVLDEA